MRLKENCLSIAASKNSKVSSPSASSSLHKCPRTSLPSQSHAASISHCKPSQKPSLQQSLQLKEERQFSRTPSNSFNFYPQRKLCSSASQLDILAALVLPSMEVSIE